jgi:hypothetical protein
MTNSQSTFSTTIILKDEIYKKNKIKKNKKKKQKEKRRRSKALYLLYNECG